jgi:hypothetical protein
MSDEDEIHGSEVGEALVGEAVIGASTIEAVWMPDPHEVGHYLRQRLKILGGRGREAETFTEQTRPSYLRVEELIGLTAPETAAIAGYEPVKKIADYAKYVCILGVCADIESSYEQESTGRDATNRDRFDKRYEKGLERLQDLVDRIQRGDDPGVDGDQAAATYEPVVRSSIPRRCGPGVSQAAW